MRTVPSLDPDTRREPSGVKTGGQSVEKRIAVTTEYADQFARLHIPESKCRIVRGGDDARPIRVEEDKHDRARMPAQDSHRLSRTPIPKPRRLVQGARGHLLAVRAERNRVHAVPVSGEDG